MSQHAFLMTAGIVFFLVAFGHLIRILFGAPVVVQGVSIPLWVSAIAVIIAGFLAYEGFHFARKSSKQ